MHISHSIVTAALVLASATFATAQTTPTPTAPAAPAAPSLGSIEIGGIFGDTDGDRARYERYRDTSDGVFTNIRFAKETDTFLFDARAYHIGYRDQSYAAEFDNGRFRATAMFDSIPLNYLYGAITPWTLSGNTFSLPDAIQLAVQNRTVNGVPCAYATSCTNPATAAVALSRRSAYNDVARLFDMDSKRETFGADARFMITDEVDARLKFSTTKRSGNMPWGAAFAFNNANELPIPIDTRTNEFGANVEWANRKGMVRLGWDVSYFNNDIESFVWDNPLRATDFNNGTAAPWDASGYSNGNGGAQGRMSLWPSSTQNVVSATGLYRLARATTVNGTLQFTTQDQDAALIPWTANSLINSVAPGAGFPQLAGLPRDTAKAGMDGVNALINFTTRPTRYLNLQARYRYNKRDITTEDFDATQNVRFDAVPEDTTPIGHSHQFDVERQIFDANATFNTNGFGSVKLGYGHEAAQRHGRGFSDLGENTFRASYDAISFNMFSLRAGWEHSRRRGEGFILAGIDYEEGPGGEQPGLRYYDEADRDRNKGSVVLTVTPNDVVSFYVQFAGGKDEYLADESIPEGREQFGLLDSTFKNWTIGTTYVANDHISLGANYGREDFNALQKSRNANPPPDASWTDPSRDWTLDNDEKINSFNVFVDLVKAVENTDIRLAYDFSDSDNAFIHGGPRIPALGAQFIPLPNVTNTWHRLSADVKYFFTTAVGVGVGYYFEKLDISDFATIDANGSVGFTPATGTVRMDYLGALVTGYMNRPYKGQNAYVRLIYMF